MTKAQKLNWVRRIVLFPFRVVFFIPMVTIGFFMTNFEDEWEVNFYRKMVKNFFK